MMMILVVVILLLLLITSCCVVSARAWLGRTQRPNAKTLRLEIEREAAIVSARLPPKRPGSKGIVMCAGGRYVAEAYASILTIRKAGCTLPVCIVHAGPDEITAYDRRAFDTAFGSTVTFLDAAAADLGVTPTKLQGFEIKPYALLLAPFHHCLLMDADCGSLGRSPSILFDEPAYRDHGTIFWPDYRIHKDLVRPWLAGTFVPTAALPPSGFEAESGQAVIDTVRFRRATVYAWLLNKHSDVFYNHYYGDKDLFRLGFLMAGDPYYQVPHAPGILGSKDGTGGIVLRAMVQKTDDDVPMFAHRTMHKRSGGATPTWDLYVPNDGEQGGSRDTLRWKGGDGTCVPSLCRQMRPAPPSWRALNRLIRTAETTYERLRSNAQEDLLSTD